MLALNLNLYILLLNIQQYTLMGIITHKADCFTPEKVYSKYNKRLMAWPMSCHEAFVNRNEPAAYTVIYVDAREGRFFEIKHLRTEIRQGKVCRRNTLNDKALRAEGTIMCNKKGSKTSLKRPEHP